MTQAEILKAICVAAWNGVEDEPDDINFYDSFHDACEVAHTMGAKGNDLPNVDPANNSTIREYLFPDGSISYVILNEHGIGCGIDNYGP